MKSRRRTSIKLFLLAGFSFALFTAYLYFGLFPGRLKAYVVTKIEELTQKKVAFDKALYLPFRGLNFENLKVMDNSGRPIFSAKQLAVDAKFIPFLREKKIVMRNVYLDNPVYDLILKPAALPPPPPLVMTKISGQIAVPVASDTKKISLSALADGPEGFLPENVYLEQIEIVHGRVTIRETSEGPLLEKIDQINVRLKFQKPPDLLFDGSFRLGEKSYALITLDGRWNLDKAEYVFDFHTKSDLVPGWLLDYQRDHFLILRKCRLALDASLQSIGESRALFRAKADIDEGLLSLNKILFQGKILADTKGLFNFETKAFERYKGSLEFVDVDVSNLSKEIASLESIRGKISFQPDFLSIDSIHGKYKKLPFVADGTIRSFEKLLLDTTIRVNASITQVLSLIPEDKKKALKGWVLQGNAQGVTKVNGSLRKPSELHMESVLSIFSASVKNPEKKIDLAGVSAEISQNDLGISIQKAKFTVDKKAYGLNLFVPKKPGAPGNLSLSSNQLRLSATYLPEGETILVRKADADLYGISADFQGKVSSLFSPRLDVQGTLSGSFLDIMRSLTVMNPSLKDLGLRGQLNGYFTLQGPWNDPKSWDLKIDGRSDNLVVKQKLRLEDAQIQVRMSGRRLNIPYLHGRFYQGTLGAQIVFDLSDEKTPFDAKVYANQVDIHALTQDLEMKEKDLAGTAMLQLNLSGEPKSQETLKGNGSIDIQKGKLWQTDQFKEMGHLPFVKVEGLDSVVFRSLNATFKIHDKKVWTEDLNIFGDAVDLSLKGTIGFDQSLDMLMDIRYSGDIMRGAMDTGGIVPLVVQQAEDLISQHRVSGTLKNPKYEKTGIPAGKAIGKKISGLFQTIVQ